MERCDSCGEAVGEADGVMINFGESQGNNTSRILWNPSEARIAQRLEDAFGKRKFRICYVCWLKSMGVKPKRRNNDSNERS